MTLSEYYLVHHTNRVGKGEVVILTTLTQTTRLSNVYRYVNFKTHKTGFRINPPSVKSILVVTFISMNR